MSSFPGMGGTAQFAPQANDSLRDLRAKAEGMLEYLRDNEDFLRRLPSSQFDEHCSLWQNLAGLLDKALKNPDLATDARLDAQRVWGEEMHHSACFIVSMCVHARSDSARKRFADDPEKLERFIAMLEEGRPRAM
jgi:hypothetical protein